MMMRPAQLELAAKTPRTLYVTGSATAYPVANELTLNFSAEKEHAQKETSQLDVAARTGPFVQRVTAAIAATGCTAPGVLTADSLLQPPNGDCDRVLPSSPTTRRIVREDETEVNSAYDEAQGQGRRIIKRKQTETFLTSQGIQLVLARDPAAMARSPFSLQLFQDVLTKVLSAANEFRLSLSYSNWDLTWSFSKSLDDLLLGEAMRNARQKGEIMTTGLGVTLGPPLAVNPPAGQLVPNYQTESAAFSSAAAPGSSSMRRMSSRAMLSEIPMPSYGERTEAAMVGEAPVMPQYMSVLVVFGMLDVSAVSLYSVPPTLASSAIVSSTAPTALVNYNDIRPSVLPPRRRSLVATGS